MNPKKPRLDAMLSSTSKDLPLHRQKAEHAISRAGFYTVKMENLPALIKREDAISVSLAMVEEAEIYIGIFGQRYGYRPKDARNPLGISVTEMEYRRALELGMPILIFIMSEAHPSPDTTGLKPREAKKVLDTFLEGTKTGEKKLAKFKAELQNNHIVAFFDSAEDLCLQVLHALDQSSLKEAAYAYYKKRQDDEKDEGDKKKDTGLKIPTPPTVYALPEYSGQNVRFVGRRDELDLLDTWGKTESATPMLVLEAIGGMGKSALAWKWLQDRAVPFDGVFWYSFYEGGAEMSACVRHALAYVTQRAPESLLTLPFEQQLSELLHALRQKRYLLVLDGLERVLVAYHRWDAAQMQDDEIQAERQHRDCTNPRDNDVLRQLAACAPSRILITSRLMPLCLQEFDTPLEGVQHLPLKGLSREDMRYLWQQAGVTWQDEAAFDSLHFQTGGHSLLAKLIAGEISKSRRYHGNFDAWYIAQDKNIDFSKLEPKAKRHHILEQAYKGLDATAKTFLSQIAAFGEAVDIDTLSVFNPYLPPKPLEVEAPTQFELEQLEDLLNELDNESERNELKAIISVEQLNDFNSEIWQKMLNLASEDEQFADLEELVEEQKQLKVQYAAYQEALKNYPQPSSLEYKNALAKLDALLTDLEERGLLWWQRETGTYDLHPVVRGYAFAQLEGKASTHERIHDYYAQQEAHFEDDKVKSLADLQPIISMYKALIGAGNLDAASRLYHQRLAYPLQDHIAAYHKAYELLLPLFREGLENLPTLSDPDQQAACLTNMAGILYLLSRNAQALYLRGLRIKLAVEREDASNLGLALSNYGTSLSQANRLAQTLRVFENLRDLGEVSKNQDNLADANLRLLSLYKDLGRWSAVESAYQAFMAAPPASQTAFWLADAQRHYADLHYKQDSSLVSDYITQAEQSCQKTQNSYGLRVLARLKGEVALQNGQIKAAHTHFSKAIQMGNESGVPRKEEYQNQSYGGLARAYLSEGRKSEAIKIVDAGTDDYSAVLVLQAVGRIDEAKERALKYYRAWAEGEPYVRRFELQRAEKLLADLGVPKPDLPPYDENNYVPFAYEAEVRAFIEKLKRGTGEDS